MKILVINTGVGNVRAIPNMLRRVGATAEITSDPEKIAQADSIILPGVGSFDAAMKKLKSNNLKEALDDKIRDGRTPTLGICLGMQLMAEGSEEGSEPGFGWIPGRLKRFHASDGVPPIRVPHMGWNMLEEFEGQPLYAGMQDDVRFYFDHSYYWQPEDGASYCGVAEYGIRFAAGVKRDNIFGVQFHPEKSHRFGLALFRNFISMTESVHKQTTKSRSA